MSFRLRYYLLCFNENRFSEILVQLVQVHQVQLPYIYCSTVHQLVDFNVTDKTKETTPKVL